MVKHTKVTPDPKSENVDDTEPVKDNSCEVGLDWNAVKVKSKPKVISSSSHASSVDIQSMKMAAYVKKRQDMKDRVVREVFAAALPDVSESMLFSVLEVDGLHPFCDAFFVILYLLHYTDSACSHHSVVSVLARLSPLFIAQPTCISPCWTSKSLNLYRLRSSTWTTAC